MQEILDQSGNWGGSAGTNWIYLTKNTIIACLQTGVLPNHPHNPFITHMSRTSEGVLKLICSFLSHCDQKHDQVPLRMLITRLFSWTLLWIIKHFMLFQISFQGIFLYIQAINHLGSRNHTILSEGNIYVYICETWVHNKVLERCYA